VFIREREDADLRELTTYPHSRKELKDRIILLDVLFQEKIAMSAIHGKVDQVRPFSLHIASNKLVILSPPALPLHIYEPLVRGRVRRARDL
jgi:hypothetical protein